MLMSQGMELLLLVVIQLVYVPMLTLRTITMVKNLRVLTAIFGFLEALVYVFGLAIVFTGEQSFIEMVVYAFGFALGLFAGVYVEQKLAIGYTSVHVNINHHNPALIKVLRERGYGVTAFDAYGKESQRVRLDILTQRKHEKNLMALIHNHEPGAFIVAYEPKTFRGGYMTKLMKKRRKLFVREVAVTVPEVKTEVDSSIILEGVNEIKEELRTLHKDWQSD